MSIAPVGPITVSGSNVLYNNGFSDIVIGTIDATSNGVGGADLIVDFAGTGVGSFEVNALVQAITLTNAATVPPAGARTIVPGD